MPEPSPSKLIESERAEWEAVLAALTRTPRLEKLLRYLGELYFQNRISEITEFQIAIEVFGRSEKLFDASRDSIARVEAYRLRKRLKEFYEADGKDHSTAISIPAGSYVPSFIHREGSEALRPVAAKESDSGSHEAASAQVISGIGAKENAEASHREPAAQAAGHRSGKRMLLYTLAIAVLLLFVSAALFRVRHWASSNLLSSTNATPSQNASAAIARANPAPIPLRLLAGYDGTPRIDSAGAYWEADRYFLGGIARTRPDQTISQTSDPMLFEHWRQDDTTYNIPLPPGPYELHLFFVASPVEDTSQAFFNVNVNGKPLLKDFNISSDALGTNIADERVFRDIYPDTDGYLHLAFLAGRSSPSVNAIEILPGLPHSQIPIRLAMQRSAVTDSNGNVWHPDNYFQSGLLSNLPQRVGGTSDPSLYVLERYGHFTYSIPVDTRDRYTLVLHFAELYWDQDGAGRRRFRILCNGSTLLDDFDIFKEVGSLRALTKTFNHLRPSPEGKLDLTFDPIENYATVSAIEVIDESQ
jgi:hypothetical protein